MADDQKLALILEDLKKDTRMVLFDEVLRKGLLLLSLRELAERGQWYPYLKIVHISDDQAERWMNVARNPDECRMWFMADPKRTLAGVYKFAASLRSKKQTSPKDLLIISTAKA